MDVLFMLLVILSVYLGIAGEWLTILIIWGSLLGFFILICGPLCLLQKLFPSLIKPQVYGGPERADMYPHDNAVDPEGDSEPTEYSGFYSVGKCGNHDRCSIHNCDDCDYNEEKF